MPVIYSQGLIYTLFQLKHSCLVLLLLFLHLYVYCVSFFTLIVLFNTYISILLIILQQRVLKICCMFPGEAGFENIWTFAAWSSAHLLT